MCDSIIFFKYMVLIFMMSKYHLKKFISMERKANEMEISSQVSNTTILKELSTIIAFLRDISKRVAKLDEKDEKPSRK